MRVNGHHLPKFRGPCATDAHPLRLLFLSMDHEELGRMYELYYLSQEAGLNDIAWTIAAMPLELRSRLRSFFQRIGDPARIVARPQPDGCLVLEPCAPHAAAPALPREPHAS